ncbi:MAG: hypothetical protein K2G94_01350 [Muribaculaceae bacterium]|nr:hypothetical protein [Muribaculaceae bacterium]
MSVMLSLIAAVAANLPVDTIASRMDYQLWSYPQEKIHVDTDRGAYLGGDTVRFRAFLVDAATHRPAEGSEYVYVELRDPFGKVAGRVKVKRRDGRFAGMLPLPKEMAEGAYTLSAYTLFMQNQGQEYFFRKPLPVKSYYSLKYKLDSEFTPDGRLRVSLTEGQGRRPVESESLTLSGPDGVVADAGRKKSSYTFRISDKVRDGGVVSVRFDNYEKFIALPPDTSRLQVSFHPEGGHLIPGEMNTVAFRAVDTAGRGVDVSGAVFGRNGERVAGLHSRRSGTGTVQFIPELGCEYTARIAGRDYPLPAVEASAAVVRVATNKADRLTVSASGAVPDGALLLAHSRGRLLYADTVSSGRPVRFASDALGDGGTVQFLLADSQGRLLSSRLAFVYPREVPDSLIGPGDYSVSVTASEYAVPDTANSIVAQLLLQSELGDYVEDAAYYFRRPDRTVRADLDALLLTQDWKRYDLAAVIGGRITDPQMPMEIGGELSGVVKSRWRGKPLEGADVNVLAPSMEYAATVKTDSLGRFAVTGVDWPDGTAFVFQATGKKGDREHNFEVDRDRFPDNNSVIIPRWHAADTASDPDFGPILGYGSDILLNEITVTAEKSEEEMQAAMFKALGVKSVTDADMAVRNFTTYEECLRNIPGIRIVNGAVYSTRASSIYGSGTGVEFWVDGSLWNSFSLTGAAYIPSLRFMQPIGEQYTPVSLPKADAVKLSEFENAYPLSTIKSIEYYNSSIALMISSSAAYNGGALVFKTKSYDKTPDWETQLFTRVVTPFGYQNKPATYRPYSQYRETIDGTVNTSVWTPITDKVDSVDCQSKRAVISGISSDTGLPVFIVKEAHQSEGRCGL